MINQVSAVLHLVSIELCLVLLVLVQSPFPAAVILGNSCFDFDTGKVRRDLLEKYKQ